MKEFPEKELQAEGPRLIGVQATHDCKGEKIEPGSDVGWSYSPRDMRAFRKGARWMFERMKAEQSKPMFIKVDQEIERTQEHTALAELYKQAQKDIAELRHQLYQKERIYRLREEDDFKRHSADLARLRAENEALTKAVYLILEDDRLMNAMKQEQACAILDARAVLEKLKKEGK
jgi:hypothetical protein